MPARHVHVLIPDILVARRDAANVKASGTLDAGEVALAVEIVLPGSRIMERLTKPAVYEGGGICSFGRVELEDGPAIFAYRLEQGRYVEVGVARPGGPRGERSVPGLDRPRRPPAARARLGLPGALGNGCPVPGRGPAEHSRPLPGCRWNRVGRPAGGAGKRPRSLATRAAPRADPREVLASGPELGGRACSGSRQGARFRA